MLHKRSIKEKLLKGGAWAFAGKMVTALSGLAISALLARLLTPEEMGAYFLTFSLVSVAAIVAQLGLTQTIVRLVAESMGTDRPGRARRSVILVLRIVGFSGLTVACLLAFGVGQWISEQLFKSVIMSQVMGLAAAWAIVITFQSLMAEVYRGFHDIRLATIFGGLTTSLISMGLFLGLWLMQGHGNLDQIMTLVLGAGISSVLFSSVLLWNKLTKLPSEKNNITLTEVLRISWPLWITNLTLLLLVESSLWIVGIFSTSEEVALFGSASRLVILVTMPLLIINMVVPPLIAEMYAQRKMDSLEKALQSVATLAGVPALFALGLFMFFGDSILGWVFGGFYKEAGVILAVLSIGQLANVWAGSCGLTLMLTGHQFIMMVITMFCGTLVVLVSWMLAPYYGALGVAAVAAAGMVMQNGLMLVATKKKVGVWTHMRPSLIKNARAVL